MKGIRITLVPVGNMYLSILPCLPKYMYYPVK